MSTRKHVLSKTCLSFFKETVKSSKALHLSSYCNCCVRTLNWKLITTAILEMIVVSKCFKFHESISNRSTIIWIVLKWWFNCIKNVLMIYCLIFERHKKCQVIILCHFLWNYISLPRALVEINWVDWHKRMCVHIKSSRTDSLWFYQYNFATFW